MKPAVYSDPFDPRGWKEPRPYRVIWLDPKNNLFCIVDEEDADWALQWLWSATPNSRGKKFYATRSTRLYGADGPQTKIYMHKEILMRSGLTPPSSAHTIGDHWDDDSLNNRRGNLRWATVSENNKRKVRA
jgi:hypothetical protein